MTPMRLKVLVAPVMRFGLSGSCEFVHGTGRNGHNRNFQFSQWEASYFVVPFLSSTWSDTQTEWN